MSKLAVESRTIAEVLDLLRSNTWLVPSFQRDFVWSEADVTSLALSVIEARPIGMATLWEQADDSELHLEPASISDTLDGKPVEATLSTNSDKPKKFYAVLDGRQRATALAMVFGGLRATDARRKFSGRYFLDVSHPDESERVRYIKDAQVKSQNLDQIAVCIGRGLFPLATDPSVSMMSQWLTYIQEIKEPNNYPNQTLPEAVELERRDAILKKAFQGITDTVLAVYVVPTDYDLGDICEIFETLNTTGTKVSTVDLMHSWLYNDTIADPEQIHLREWIDDLGQKPGAIGWSSRLNRPELIAQAVTAAYVAIDSDKPAPRSVGGRKKTTSVSSIKASDLLATPAAFWKQVIDEEDVFASYLGDFQRCVSDRYFPMLDCPYPVMIAMYVGLRWYMAHDSRYAQQWSQHELDGVFRAFFWRNSLASRYDQGFLSQSATDMKSLKEVLFSRSKSSSANAWAQEANEFLDRSMGLKIPTFDELRPQLLDAKPAGAVGRALSLPVRTRPEKDLLDPGASILFPSDQPVELHHIYPKAWCASNQHGVLGAILDRNRADFDYVGSVANLTPLTRESNNAWRANTPGQALAAQAMGFETARSRLESHFIGEPAYMALTADSPSPLAFWEARAESISGELISRCSVSL